MKKAITIHPFIYRDLKLKGAEAIVYALIYSYGARGYDGTLEGLMVATNDSRQAITSTLRRLCERGHITKTEIKGSRSSCYKAVLPEGVTYQRAERQDNIAQAKQEALKTILHFVTCYFQEVCYDYSLLARNGAPNKDLYQKQGEAHAIEAVCREIGEAIAKAEEDEQ